MAHKIPYAVSYRDIKYPRIELKTGKVLLIIPFGKTPDAVLEKHQGWILRKIDFISSCLKAARGKRLAARTDGEFMALVNRIADEIAMELKVKLKGISFRKMKTKWASMSSKKKMTVNMLMRHLPIRLIRYIVYHEMAHLIEKKHNENFWKIISRRYKNHDSIEKEMFVYWFLIYKKKR